MKKSNCSARPRRNEWEIPTFYEVTATHLIRRMNGNSRSVLALGEDELCYVVKFAGNPKGRNALANELLGYQLAKALDIRVPETFIVEVDPFLIRYAPKDWFEGYLLGLRPQGSIHFGTQFIGYPADASTTEILPRRKFSQIRNRDDFLGMLIFDAWAKHPKSSAGCVRGTRLPWPVCVLYGFWEYVRRPRVRFL